MKKMKKISSYDMLSSFGCSEFETEILSRVNRALEKGEMPSFEAYNSPKLGRCSCRSGECSWNEEEIVSRLKKKGIWDKILDALNEN